MRSVIQTASGLALDLALPAPNGICIEDIARGLSHVCRFSGQLATFYSVAQHSVLVSELMPEQHALWGLLHDASEAYLGDLCSPLKEMKQLLGYRILERQLMRAICTRFGICHAEPDGLKHADLQALRLEAETFKMPLNQEVWGTTLERLPKAPEGIMLRAMSPDDARYYFLERYEELTQPKKLPAKVAVPEELIGLPSQLSQDEQYP